jgi:pyruvate,water dikinase
MMNVVIQRVAFAFSMDPQRRGWPRPSLNSSSTTLSGIHPKRLSTSIKCCQNLQQQILERTGCYSDPIDFFTEKLCEGIATLGAAFNPKPVIVRLSDFKSTEYANMWEVISLSPRKKTP